MTTFNTRVTFDHVRNTAAGYTSANPVLGYGVIGLETDTGRAKIGDGVTAWNTLGYFSGQIDWAGITSKPTAFPPASHGHAIADVSGLSVALDGKQPAGSYAASVHNHDDRYYTETEVDTLLAGKQATGSYVLTTDARLSDARQPLTHQHVAANITDFTAAVIAAAPPTVDASLLTQGTLPDARISSAIARTSDVTAAVANVVNAAPAALDTLNELAAALGNDASFATTVTNSLAGKAALVHTHTVSAITDAGTAATRNVPATGNAGATEVVLGSDTRLTDSRTPTGHAHGNINNLGQMSAASTLDPTAVGGPAVFGALAGTIGRGQFGTSAGTVCQGDDSRLSDARTPVSHTHSASQVTDFASAVAAAAPPEVLDFLTTAQFPATGSASKIYVATDASRAYQWTGSQYAEIGPAGAFLPVHSHAASDITSGVLDAARLPSSGVSASSLTTGTLEAARIGTHSTSHNPGGSDPVTLVEVYEFTRTSRPAAASGSSGSYTFTIPAAAKAVEFYLIGGGGGGGSGRRGAATTARFGGGGGAAGCVTQITRLASELSSRSLTIEVGAGGVGGAAVTANDTNGNNASAATNSQVVFGSFDNRLNADRGGAGSGGTASAGTGGTAASSGAYLGSAGGNSSVTATPSGVNAASPFASAGGGGGGGISAADASQSGALGRAQGWILNVGSGGQVNSSGGTAPGGNGQNASAAFTQVLGAHPGGAGAGGAAGNASTAGGNGGNGANYGGAGGGGGASFNGFSSGAGGNGADGIVRITVWY